MKNKDNKQNSKILINGSYSILLTVLLLAGLIIVNLIVNHLPVKVTQFDFSNEKLYTLTDITTGILKNLDQDVELYYICEGGKEDDTIQKLLDRYESASSGTLSVVIRFSVSGFTLSLEITSPNALPSAVSPFPLKIYRFGMSLAVT